METGQNKYWGDKGLDGYQEIQIYKKQSNNPQKNKNKKYYINCYMFTRAFLSVALLPKGQQQVKVGQKPAKSDTNLYLCTNTTETYAKAHLVAFTGTFAW